MYKSSRGWYGNLPLEMCFLFFFQFEGQQKFRSSTPVFSKPRPSRGDFDGVWGPKSRVDGTGKNGEGIFFWGKNSQIYKQDVCLVWNDIHKHRRTCSKFQSLSLRHDLEDWWHILGTSFRNLPNEGICLLELILVGCCLGSFVDRADAFGEMGFVHFEPRGIVNSSWKMLKSMVDWDFLNIKHPKRPKKGVKNNGKKTPAFPVGFEFDEFFSGQGEKQVFRAHWWKLFASEGRWV